MIMVWGGELKTADHTLIKGISMLWPVRPLQLEEDLQIKTKDAKDAEYIIDKITRQITRQNKIIIKTTNKLKKYK